MQIGSAIFGVLVALVGTFLSSTGMILQKIAYLRRDKETETKRQERELFILDNPDEDHPPEVIPKIIFWYWIWYVGICLMGISALLDVAPSSLLAPMAAVTLVFNTILSFLVLHEKISKLDIVSIIIIVVGAVLAIVFGSRDETDHDLDGLIELYNDKITIAYLCSLGGLITIFMCAIAAITQILKHTNIELIKKIKILIKIHPILYGATGGLYGGFTTLLAKSASVIVSHIFSGNFSAFTRFETYLMMLALFVSGLLQVRFLNGGLAKYAASIVVPLYQTVWIIGTILSGAIYFKEVQNFNETQSVMFPLAIIVTLIGLWILSANQKSAAVAPDISGNNNTATDVERISYIPIQPQDMDEKDKPMSLRNNTMIIHGSNTLKKDSLLNSNLDSNNNENGRLIGAVISQSPSLNNTLNNNHNNNNNNNNQLPLHLQQQKDKYPNNSSCGTIASLPSNNNNNNKPSKKRSAIAPEPTTTSISTVSTVTMNSVQSHTTIRSGSNNIPSSTTNLNSNSSVLNGNNNNNNNSRQLTPYNNSNNSNSLPQLQPIQTQPNQLNNLNNQQQKQQQQQPPPTGSNTNLLYISTVNNNNVDTPHHLRNIQLPPLRVPGAGVGGNNRVNDGILEQSIGGSQSLPIRNNNINPLNNSNNLLSNNNNNVLLPPRPNTVDVSTGEIRKNLVVDSLILPDGSPQENDDNNSNNDNSNNIDGESEI